MEKPPIDSGPESDGPEPHRDLGSTIGWGLLFALAAILLIVRMMGGGGGC